METSSYFHEEERYHLPNTQRQVEIIHCVKVKTYSLLRRYSARRELKKLYRSSQNETVIGVISQTLSQTGIYNWLRKAFI